MKNIRKSGLATVALAALITLTPLAAQAASSISPQNIYQNPAPGPASNTAAPDHSRLLISGTAMNRGNAACPFKEDALGIWHDANGRVATRDVVRRTNCQGTGSTSNNAGNPGNGQEGSSSGSPVSR